MPKYSGALQLKCCVTILDASGGIATANALSADYIDYLHLAKIDGEWKIVNVLWERRHPR